MTSAPGRYLFHDLLRAYANECAVTWGPEAREVEEPETAGATRRMLDHYVHTAHLADRIFNPTRDPVTLPAAEPGTAPESVGDALVWFSAEHRVLLRVTRFAAATGHDRTVGRLSWALVTYLNRQGHWHDWVEVQRAALSAYTRLGDRAGQAVTAMNLGRAHTRLGTFDLAEPHYLRARDLYRDLGDEAGLGHVNLNLGWMCDQQGGRYQEALDYAIQARRHYLAAGHQVGQANALNSAGWYQAQLGGYAEAVAHCDEALALQRVIGDQRAQANTLDSLGFAHHHLGNLTEAIRCYEQAVAIQREVGERYQMADSLVHLAETLSAAGRHADARISLEQALAICQELNHADSARISKLLTDVKYR
jgi:tetratricopeptide (TPR) repeat protein